MWPTLTTYLSASGYFQAVCKASDENPESCKIPIYTKLASLFPSNLFHSLSFFFLSKYAERIMVLIVQVVLESGNSYIAK